MKILFTIIIASLGVISSVAQTPFRQNHTFDFALSFGSDESNAALSWSQVHGITKNNKFRLGYGARLNYYVGKDKDYTTAPAKLTSEMEGLGVIFSETYPENIDTFRVAGSSMGSVNAAIYLEYQIKPKWVIGFNIDAIGFSFGPEVQGIMISDMAPSGAALNQNARPTPLNVLLTSDNDIGMLNSELYARYSIDNKMALRAGFTFEFTEYTTNEEIAYNFNNDRFRHKSLMGMIAFSFRPWDK